MVQCNCTHFSVLLDNGDPLADVLGALLVGCSSVDLHTHTYAVCTVHYVYSLPSLPLSLPCPLHYHFSLLTHSSLSLLYPFSSLPHLHFLYLLSPFSSPSSPTSSSPPHPFSLWFGQWWLQELALLPFSSGQPFSQSTNLSMAFQTTQQLTH